MPEQITQFWKTRNPSGEIVEESKLLCKLIFHKRKQGVSENYVLQQLKEALELRHEFLEARSLDVNHVLHDGIERCDFLRFAKERFHSDPEQKRLQERDAEKGGNKKRRAGKHSRWGLDMQRRCGDKALWELVSFTGGFSVATLASIPNTVCSDRDEANLSNQKQCTQKARRARNRLRFAKSLTKKQ